VNNLINRLQLFALKLNTRLFATNWFSIASIKQHTI